MDENISRVVVIRTILFRGGGEDQARRLARSREAEYMYGIEYMIYGIRGYGTIRLYRLVD